MLIKRLILLFVLILPLSVFAGEKDTLWVARVIPGKGNTARHVVAVMASGWTTRPALGKNKVDIRCRMIFWNADRVRYDTTDMGWRLLGMDTTKVRLVYTTEDTLAAGGFSNKLLDADGKFTR